MFQGYNNDYNKIVYEGYKVRGIRKDGSIRSVSRITNKDVEEAISSLNLGFIPRKFVRLNERPYVLKHACQAVGVAQGECSVLYLYNTPVYYTFCRGCGTVYYYCVKVQDAEIENFFKLMGIYPKKFIKLPENEFNSNSVNRIRHCCKEMGIIHFNLQMVYCNNSKVYYAYCPSCQKLYYYKEDNGYYDAEE